MRTTDGRTFQRRIEAISNEEDVHDAETTNATKEISKRCIEHAKSVRDIMKAPTKRQSNWDPQRERERAKSIRLMIIQEVDDEEPVGDQPKETPIESGLDTARLEDHRESQTNIMNDRPATPEPSNLNPAINIDVEAGKSKELPVPDSPFDAIIASHQNSVEQSTSNEVHNVSVHREQVTRLLESEEHSAVNIYNDSPPERTKESLTKLRKESFRQLIPSTSLDNIEIEKE